MATCTEEIHLNDEGTIFEITLSDCSTIVDVSSATMKQILFKKPDNTTVLKTAAFKTDGTDGIVQYATVTGDLDQEGSWEIQARVVLPTGSWSSSTDVFIVHGNLD